jgi:hypothetical protein
VIEVGMEREGEGGGEWMDGVRVEDEEALRRQ